MSNIAFISAGWCLHQSKRFGFFIAKAFCIIFNPYFWYHPTVLSELQTIKLLAQGKSIGRFGDGEIALIMGASLYFQKYSDKLSSELVCALNSDGKNYLVGIPTVYDDANLNKDYVNTKLWSRFEKYSKLVLPRSTKFASAFITRPIVKRIQSHKYFDDFRAIWRSRHIVYVHHDRLKINHPLFANAKKRTMIICAKQNAYSQIDELEQKCLLSPKTAIFLLSAGPAATVLAHRLTKSGRQAIDIGHLTFEYELHQRGKVTNKQSVASQKLA